MVLSVKAFFFQLRIFSKGMVRGGDNLFFIKSIIANFINFTSKKTNMNFQDIIKEINKRNEKIVQLSEIELCNELD